MAYMLCSWYVFFFSFPLAVCQGISGDGICMPPNSSLIKCCIGHYLKENQCLECDPGYTGENCSWTCPSGFYGRMCNERCACSPDEYCDPTRGCLCNQTIANCTDAGHYYLPNCLRMFPFSLLRQRAQRGCDRSTENAYSSMAPGPSSNFCRGPFVLEVVFALLLIFSFGLLI